MRLLKALGAFCYEFVIGDDWKIAVYTVAVLAAVSLLAAAGVVDDRLLPVVGTVLLAVCFAGGVWMDARRTRR